MSVGGGRGPQLKACQYHDNAYINTYINAAEVPCTVH